jgi:hypothetical protein
VAEREGGNSWGGACFCEKKKISTAFYGIKSVTVFVIQDFDTLWGADEDSIFRPRSRRWGQQTHPKCR